VLGASCKDPVENKTERAKHGATTKGQSPPLQTTKQAYFGVVGRRGAHLRDVRAVLLLRASLMYWTPLSPMEFDRRLQGPNKQQSQTASPPLTTRRAHLPWGGWGRGRALERGEPHVDLESLADEFGPFNTDLAVGKTARVKQGAVTNCQPLPLQTRKRAHLGWWGRGERT
jgi:hypothetical protein